jgi:hypothetical protein
MKSTGRLIIGRNARRRFVRAVGSDLYESTGLQSGAKKDKVYQSAVGTDHFEILRLFDWVVGIFQWIEIRWWNMCRGCGFWIGLDEINRKTNHRA